MLQKWRKEITTDWFFFQILCQAMIYISFLAQVDTLELNVGFLVGSLVSLANFNLMIQQAQGVVPKDGKAQGKRMVGGFLTRFVTMAAVLFLAMQVRSIHPLGVLTGVFSIQAVIFFKGIFGHWFGRGLGQEI